MKNKAPLALMEQTLMVLIFALAAAFCLRAFVWADVTSRKNAARDRALLQAQSAAEILKSRTGDYAASAALFGGRLQDGAWHVGYDAQWNETAGDPVYDLWVLPGQSGQDYLATASVEVLDADGERLVLLPVSWQEVAADG